MATFEGRVALITGAARGQGRAHAVRLAGEGADIVALDLCAQVDTVPYPMGTHEELAHTVELVEGQGRRIVAVACDVRQRDALAGAIAQAADTLGPISIAVANAGIWSMSPDDWGQQPWYDCIDIMLTGTYHTVDLIGRHMVENSLRGSIVITSSVAGLTGLGSIPLEASNPGFVGYVAAKHGVVGIMRHYAALLAPWQIRVNSVHPSGVNTPMIQNESVGAFVANFPAIAASFKNAMPVDAVEPEHIASAVAWLCSDQAQYVTGVTLPVDAGYLVQ